MSSLLPQKLSAVVFDFDGVLVESVDIKTQAFAALYAEHGGAVQKQVVAHHLAFGSVSRFEKIRHYETVLLNRSVTQDEVLVLAERFGQMVEDAVVASPAVDGALTLLDHLSGRMAMFVVSGTPEVELQRITQRRGMSKYFREVRGSPEKKPAILRDLIERFGLIPDESVMIGDSLGDYEAAAVCGLSFIGRVPDEHANPFPRDIPIVANLLPLGPVA
jgi:phosphoglycolate phosphatase-like HAD superfamily hydrolase